MNKPVVVIQYPFIALYRMPVFLELSGSKAYDYTFWTGKQSTDQYLKSAYDDTALRMEEVPLRTITIPLVGKQLELQFSSIGKLFRVRPDVYILLANPNSLSAWFSMLAARMAGSIVLGWSHGYLRDEKGLKGGIRKLFYRLAHGHLLYGNRAREIMLKKGFRSDTLDVIYNSLDYPRQASLRDVLGIEDRRRCRKRYGIGEKDVVLISIGRLMKKLKIDQAIEGLKILLGQGRKVFLIVVGDGPEMERLQGLSRELGVEGNVIFYGACHDEEQLSVLFNASDMSVVMGKVGLSAMHALGYGVPMLTNASIESHFPEIEAVVDGRTGWFFREDDIEDFASKVRRVAYRGEIYGNCIQTIEANYTPARQKELIEAAMDKYLAAARA